MKTIGYSDKCDGSGRIYVYTESGTKYDTLFNQKRNARIISGMNSIKGLGNIYIYYINGNKARLIGEREF